MSTSDYHIGDRVAYVENLRLSRETDLVKRIHEMACEIAKDYPDIENMPPYPQLWAIEQTYLGARSALTCWQEKGGLKEFQEELAKREVEIAALTAEVERLRHVNANLNECYEYTKAGDYFAAAAIGFLDNVEQHLDEQGNIAGNGKWRLDEIAKYIGELRRANDERLKAVEGIDDKHPIAVEVERLRAEVAALKDECHRLATDRYCEVVEPLQAEVERLQSQLAAAEEMLRKVQTHRCDDRDYPAEVAWMINEFLNQKGGE